MNNFIVVQNEELAYTMIDGAVVIVESRTSQLYWLNPVASRIWLLSDGTNRMDAIADQLCLEYEVDGETALHDVVQMIKSFVAKGMLALEESRD